MSVFQFVLACLACYRLTVLFARDSGPYGLFKKLRKLKPFGTLFSCPYCVSIWIAFGIESAFLYAGVNDGLAVSVCIVFALSAVSIILDRMFTADHIA